VAEVKPKIEIPEWIPRQQWDAFIEMRCKIKAKPTDRGILLLISALQKLRHSDDIGAVLDQSTMHNWKGVFPVKHGTNAHAQRERQPSAHDKFNAGAAAFIASLGGDDEQRGQGEIDGAADGAGLPLLAPRLLTGTGG